MIGRSRKHEEASIRRLEGAPLAEDPYAYFHPEGEHSTRSVVNTRYQTGNGTQPIWSTPTTRLLGALADSYHAP